MARKRARRKTETPRFTEIQVQVIEDRAYKAGMAAGRTERDQQAKSAKVPLEKLKTDMPLVDCPGPSTRFILDQDSETYAAPDVFTHPTGAVRSALAPRYDLIPTSGLRRLAKRYAGPPGGSADYGEFNWYQGLPAEDVLNHVIDHLVEYRDDLKKFKMHLAKYARNVEKPGPAVISQEDHLAGAAWGCFALMEYEKRGLISFLPVGGRKVKA